MIFKLLLIFLPMWILTTFASNAVASNSGVTYQGRILRPDGTPLSGTNTQFKLQLRTPDSGACLLYEEVQSQDLSHSNGAFSITINDGSGSRTDSTGLTLDKIFANRGTYTVDPTTCTTGSGVYAPQVNDGRSFVVMFKDETMASYEPIPAQKINFVPFAFEAKQVQGFTADSILKVVDGSGNPQTGISPLSNAQYAALLALANGSSTAYTAAGTLGGSALPTMTSGQVLGWNGTAWTSTSATPAANSITQTMIQNGAVSTSQIDPAVTINTSGTLGAAITTTRDFKIYAGSPSTYFVEMKAPALTSSYTLTWPLTAGSPNQVLTTDGTGVLTWANPTATGMSSLTGDVTASGTGAVPATVVSVGGSTAALVHSGELAANAATIANTASTIVKRDASGNFAAGTATLTGISASGSVTSGSLSTGSVVATSVTHTSSVFKDSGSNTVTLQAPTSVSSSYVLKLPSAVAATSGQVLTSDTSGNLSWSTPSTTASPTGTAAGDLSGTYPNPSVATVGSSTAALIHSAELAANGATALNTSSKLVTRDGSGNFAANVATVNGVALNNAGSTLNITNPVGGAWNMVLPATAGSSGQVMATNGSGVMSWISPVTLSTGFVNGGNSFGANSSIGNNDNFDLNVKTNNLTRLTVQAGGNVGIGTTAPLYTLDVAGSLHASADANVNSLTVGRGAYQYISNEAVGAGALQSTTSAQDVTAIGYSALAALTSGSQNTAVGMRALLADQTGSYNTAVGTGAMISGTTPTFGTAVGYNANAGGGSYATAMGAYTLTNNTGSQNTALGYLAGWDITTGQSNLMLGAFPTNNVGITTGSNNIMMGNDVRPPSQTASNQLNVGNLIYATGLGSGATASTGNVGIGTTAPSAKLQLAPGSASAGTSPLKLTSGPVMTTPENGAIEFDNTNFYMTYGGTRYPIASTSGGGSYSNVSSITGSGALPITAGGSNQNITLAGSGTGSVVMTSQTSVTNSTASTSSSSGALTVSGGLGVAGDINSGATVNAATSMTTPQIYGSSLASGNLKLDGTSNATKGNVLLATAGGNVGIGTTAPASQLSNNSVNTIDAGGIGGAGSTVNWAANAGGYVGEFYNGSSSGSGMLIKGAATGAYPLLSVDSGAQAVSGTSLLRVMANGNVLVPSGNVGIGTTEPLGSFHVKAATRAMVWESSTAATDNHLWDIDYSSGSSWALRAVNDAYSAAGTAMKVDRSGASVSQVTFPNGNVGIGTTAPGSKLTVAGPVKAQHGAIGDNSGVSIETASNTPSLTFHASDDSNRFTIIDSIQTNQLNDVVNFSTLATSNVMSLTGSGNVGIGTTSPQVPLDVNGPIRSTPLSANGGYVESGYTGSDPAQTLERWTGTGNLFYGYRSRVSNGVSYIENTHATPLGSQTWNSALAITEFGNVGIGTTAPTAKLQLAAGAAAAGTAPLKLTTGVLLSTPEDGAVEYASSNLYYTIGSTRYVIPLNTAAGNYSSVSTISNTSGSITMSPMSGNSVIVNAATVSTSPTTGALIVSGGAGISGAVNASGNINSGGTVTATTSGVFPQIYGSTAASGNIKIDGTSNATVGNVILASAGGNVGIGTTAPTAPLMIQTSGSGNVDQATRFYTPSSAGGNSAGVRIGFAALNSASVIKDYAGISSRVNANTPGSENGQLHFETLSAGVSATRMMINESGNVGIGTTAPATAFQVVGTATFGSGSTTQMQLIGGADFSALNPGTTSTGSLIQGPVNSPLVFDLLNNDAQDSIAFRYSSANNAVVDKVGFVFKGNGSVGIGTTAPTNLLDVNGTLGVAGLQISNYTGSLRLPSGVMFNGASMTGLNPSGSSLLQFNSATNSTILGIINDGINNRLRLGNYDAASPAQQAMTVQNVATGTSNTAGADFTFNGSQGTGTGAGGSILFKTAPVGSSGTTQNTLSTALAITSSGNVGIGTTAPTQKFDLALGSVSSQPAVTLGQNMTGDAGGSQAFIGQRMTLLANAGGNRSGFIRMARTPGDTFHGMEIGTETAHALRILTGGTADSNERMRVDSSGNVGIGTTAPTYQLQLSTDSAAKPGTSTWTIASDVRLKDIRAPFTRSLEALDGLHTIYFNYKKDNPLGLPSDKEYVGIKAQDALKVIPEAVSQDEKGFYHVTNDSIIWTTVNSVKELYHRWLDESQAIHREIASLSSSKAEKSDVDTKLGEKDQQIQKLQRENALMKARLDKIEMQLNQIK